MNKTSHKYYKVTQDITHQDGSTDQKIREFKSLSEFKRVMSIMGFPVHLIYDLKKHGFASFDYDEFSVNMSLSISEKPTIDQEVKD